MEGDRNLSLLVRAVSRGALNLTNYDPQNALDKLRIRWILQDLDYEITAKIVEGRHRHQCAMLGSDKIDTQAWDNLQKQAINSFDELRYFICPWDHKKPSQEQGTDDASDIIAAYERAFGKPGTPEHDALIAETNELLKLTPEQQELRRIRRRMRDEPAV